MSWAFGMFFFFLFQNFTSFSLLNVYLSRDQWMATTITINEMNVVSRCICISSSSMLFFFVFFFVLNNYLQLDYMYRMATRTMHGGLEVGITMNGGRRAWDASWSVLSLKYVFFFFSPCVEINIANDNAYRIQFDLGKGGGKQMGGYKHMYLLIYVVRHY